MTNVSCVLCISWLVFCVSYGDLAADEKRALAFLATEVPAWRPANRCFSCPNNGDGARALFAGMTAKLPVDPAATADTLEFLRQPQLWNTNGPDGEFNDRKLARLQFAHALADATKRGLIRDRQALISAAEMLVADQTPQGSWDFPGEDVIGSPVTYGRPLATAVALRILRQADAEQFAKSIASAESWLCALDVGSVLNAAATVIGLSHCTTPAAATQRERCLEIISNGQTRDGGWGPYLNSPPEPFDTAVVLWALTEDDRKRWSQAISAGREFIRQSQLADGSWPESTRPAGRDSYAQRLATTAWATIALIEAKPAE